MANKLREEELVSAAYEVAEKMFNIYRAELSGLRVDKDDYLQDAVMYILGLYEKDYMNLDNERKPHGMIFTMLKRFTKNQIQKNARDTSRNLLTLDRPVSDDNDSSQVDRLPSKFKNNPEQISIEQENYEEGEKILYDIIEEFDVVPYKTTKHDYKGKHPILGKNLKLSEYNIGRLLLMGLNEYDILKVYDAYDTNIGSSSRATYVHRKVKNIINKLANIINELTDEERKSVKEYLSKR